MFRKINLALLLSVLSLGTLHASDMDNYQRDDSGYQDDSSGYDDQGSYDDQSDYEDPDSFDNFNEDSQNEPMRSGNFMNNMGNMARQFNNRGYYGDEGGQYSSSPMSHAAQIARSASNMVGPGGLSGMIGSLRNKHNTGTHAGGHASQDHQDSSRQKQGKQQDGRHISEEQRQEGRKLREQKRQERQEHGISRKQQKNMDHQKQHDGNKQRPGKQHDQHMSNQQHGNQKQHNSNKQRPGKQHDQHMGNQQHGNQTHHSGDKFKSTNGMSKKPKSFMNNEHHSPKISHNSSSKSKVDHSKPSKPKKSKSSEHNN